MPDNSKNKYAGLATMLGLLGRSQGEELRASCPLHSERHPSFSLNLATGLWTCFSRCGSGNFEQLVEKKMNFSPQEARDWVASNGTQTTIEQLDSQLKHAFSLPTAQAVQAKPTYWLEKYQMHDASVMPQWLLDRGFTWDTINHWKMVYDPFMQAVIIPAFWEGQMVGTITRNTMDGYPKYKNSDDLPKEKMFFGEISRDKRSIIICEGVLDAVWFWQLGYHGVSLLGAEISRAQVQILQSYKFGEITLALDNDAAGKQGTRNAVAALTAAGWLTPQINIMRFPGRNKEDPEYRKDANDCSPEELRVLYENRGDVLQIWRT